MSFCGLEVLLDLLKDGGQFVGWRCWLFDLLSVGCVVLMVEHLRDNKIAVWKRRKTAEERSAGTETDNSEEYLASVGTCLDPRVLALVRALDLLGAFGDMLLQLRAVLSQIGAALVNGDNVADQRLLPSLVGFNPNWFASSEVVAISDDALLVAR
jgi:hypothetical protein